LRGFAALAVSLVVVFHVGLLSTLGALLRGGFIGVDLFFVISGYLITGLLIREHALTGRVSFSHFYARRVRRILPAAGVVLLITIPLTYKLLDPLGRSSAMLDGASRPSPSPTSASR